MENIILDLDFLSEDIIPVSEQYERIGREIGGNSQHVLVILNSAQYEINEYKLLFEKILSSVKLDAQKDVLTFALTSKIPFNLLRYAAQKTCTKVIVFGIPMKQLGVHQLFSKYEVNRIGDLDVVVSDDFQDLEIDLSKKLKMALWKALKVLVGA